MRVVQAGARELFVMRVLRGVDSVQNLTLVVGVGSETSSAAVFKVQGPLGGAPGGFGPRWTYKKVLDVSSLETH